ncbi:Uncharacterized protein OS=Planctomyces maris DSM 8797 GN=PM8797T_25391 PE=4 SV=1: Prenyltrans_2 [Gemmata massiliana]|uniref:Squalene cyclase C-terminal domain-containing protein n=1 Tax=Gemmata massiliana TaxID=1210884 RepID=A0A6P2D527_9BACT|nr:prenyltransferase/squalene oxidase repeat-containing protein [Gemmata massiliana]VTR96239.1 Uncharacterized protein OS=Planctomyces maris DSM 8797 GN=PM8797T_25391 PE=4 SV=1: Prenyltrans_2 [Gemmata massiliana]
MRTCAFFAFLFIYFVGAREAAAQEVLPQIDRPTRTALDRGLQYLHSKQENDGSWDHSVETTAFVILATLSNGHGLHEGKYTREMQKAVRYLLACQNDDGLISDAGNTRTGMVAHSYAALALTQVQGMTPDANTQKAIRKAVKRIESAQTVDGTWRADSLGRGNIISLTFRQIIVLRAAKDNGLFVSDDHIKAAARHVKNRWDVRAGRYRYETSRWADGPQMKYGSTAAELGALLLGGEYEAKELTNAIPYLEQQSDRDYYFWQNLLFGSYLYHQVGGTTWEKYYNRVRTTLLENQHANGFWDWEKNDIAFATRNHQTAIALWVLSVPAEYLPIFQR